MVDNRFTIMKGLFGAADALVKLRGYILWKGRRGLVHRIRTPSIFPSHLGRIYAAALTRDILETRLDLDVNIGDDIPFFFMKTWRTCIESS
ncbi:hypothetical protein ACTXT7_006604 [Hymenolepis weldensis]